MTMRKQKPKKEVLPWKTVYSILGKMESRTGKNPAKFYEIPDSDTDPGGNSSLGSGTPLAFGGA